MKLKKMLNELKADATAKVVNIDAGALADIVVYKKRNEIKEIVEDVVNEYKVNEGTKEAKKRLRSLTKKVIGKRLKNIDDANELVKEKNEIIKESKNVNSPLFKKIRSLLEEEINNYLEDSSVAKSIVGAANNISGTKFEEVVKKQILSENDDYPIEGLISFINDFFKKTYGIDFDLTDFEVVKSKSTSASYDIQITTGKGYISFLNIHVKFLQDTKSPKTWSLGKVEFKSGEYRKKVESALKTLAGENYENYVDKEKGGKGGVNKYHIEVFNLMNDVGLNKINSDKNKLRALEHMLRVGYDDIIAAKTGYGSTLEKFPRIGKIEESGEGFLIKDEEGNDYIRITPKGALKVIGAKKVNKND